MSLYHSARSLEARMNHNKQWFPLIKQIGDTVYLFLRWNNSGGIPIGTMYVHTVELSDYILKLTGSSIEVVKSRSNSKEETLRRIIKGLDL